METLGEARLSARKQIKTLRQPWPSAATALQSVSSPDT